jgi:cupin fold WbuC family metalloprotein
MVNRSKNFSPLSDLVLATEGSVAILSSDVLANLSEQALSHQMKKARILLHGSPDHSLHEMLIAHCNGVYIRPHINELSAKSFLVLEGKMMVFFFDDSGGISDRYCLGSQQSGADFMLRIQDPVFHTIVVMSKTVIFLETILGPHQRTRYASFAPDPDNDAASDYFAWLEGESR